MNDIYIVTEHEKASNFKSFHRPRRLVMIQVHGCDFCNTKSCDSGLLAFFEGINTLGFQYCKKCQPDAKYSIFCTKRRLAREPEDQGRRPLYLTFNDHKDSCVEISWGGQRENSPFECQIHLVRNPDRGKEQFRVHTSFTRISRSYGELIWRSSCGFDVPLSTLIRQNRKFFGDKPADFPFNIDMNIHEKKDVEYWKEIIKVSYDKAADEQ